MSAAGPPSEAASVCRYWASKGSCFYGHNCRFSHAESARGGVAAAEEEKKKASPATTAAAASLPPPFVPSGAAVEPLVGAAAPPAFPEFVPQQHHEATAAVVASSSSSSHHHHHHLPPSTAAAVAASAVQHQAAAAVAMSGGHVHGLGGGHGHGGPGLGRGATFMQRLPGDVRNRAPQKLYPIRRQMPSFFMDDTLRQQLQRENELIVTRLQPDDPQYSEMPLSIHHDKYHSVWPVPFDVQNRSSTFPSKMYKVTSSEDGVAYALRRVIGCRIHEETALDTLRPWMEAENPHVVAIRDVFSCRDFNDGGSLCLVADYYPGAQTLETQYFSQTDMLPIPEEVIWSYVCQITAALASIHSRGLACRVVVPKRILLTETNRVRLNWCGIGDVLGAQSQVAVPQLQYEDLVALARLVLTLACRRRDAYKNVHNSFVYMETQYSGDLISFVDRLLDKADPKNLPTVFDIGSIISHRLLNDAQNLYAHADALRSELAKEVQNGRLFRLLVKMGFVNERPEFANDPNWAENEERYLIKLFRDFLFHTVHEDGTPHLNFAHVVQTLNKLDVGSPEKTLLMSRNEESMLIVSYADIRKCVEEAYQELAAASQTHQGGYHG